MPQDNERIAVVEKAVEGIEKGVSRLEQKLDSLIDSLEKKFVPRHEYESTQNHVHSKMEDLQDELKQMKEKNGKIVGGIVTALITLAAAIITALLGK